MAAERTSSTQQDLPAQQPLDEIQAELFPKFGNIFQTLETVLAEREMIVDDITKRGAVAIAVLIRDPNELGDLARYWGTTEKVVRIGIFDAYSSPHAEELGGETFDRDKEYRAQLKRGQETRDPDLQRRIFDRSFEKALENLDMVLTPRELEVFHLYQEGNTNTQIAEKLGLQTNSVHRMLSGIRRKIEQTRFKPRNIRRVASFKSESLSNAAQLGTLINKRFLRRKYTTAILVNLFEYQKQEIDPGWTEQGWMLLYGAVPYNEYVAFKTSQKYAQYVRKHPGSGFWYTRNEYIPILMELRGKSGESQEQPIVDEYEDKID